MSRVNKFNIHWQKVRVEAKALSEAEEKIALVLGFLWSHPNMHNYDRVLNWVRMSSMAAKGNHAKRQYDEAEHWLRKQQSEFMDPSDMSNSLTPIETSVLEAVLRDLNKRTYNFQYNGHKPKAHTEFVARIQEELERRNKGW